MVLVFILAFATAASAGAPLPSNAYAFDTRDPKGAELCLSLGGVATPGAEGQQICTLPKGCTPATGPRLLRTEFINPDSAEARKACTSACGQLSFSKTGQPFCNKAAAGTRGWAPPREPTN